MLRKIPLRRICALSVGLSRPQPSTHHRLTLQRRCYASAAAADKQSERHDFMAETKNLLDIVANSLYSEKDVFIRELISNASDALEKRRLAEHAAPGDAQLEICITAEQDNIVIADTGIGMTKEDLVSLLGTIAKSGSREFRSKDAESARDIIGQFGVGFYSAFMVADRIVVKTKTHDEGAAGWRWTWDGANSYEVEADDSAQAGCTIELKLRAEDAKKFGVAEEVIEAVNKYSQFVTVPIYVNEEQVNTSRALWTMNSSEVTRDMHEGFYRQLAKTHYPHLSTDRPRYTIHYKTDAPINVRSLLYVPSHKISQLEFASGFEEAGISLYARKVLIKAHAKELLPHYLRFIVGVVDSEDIPLNLSREMLQKDTVLIKLRQVLTERVIRHFVSESKKDREKYKDFYSSYSMFFKEAIVSEQDFSVRENIARMLLFESSKQKTGTLTSLEEYIERMAADDNTIYYMFSTTRDFALNSPYYEAFKEQKKEALFLYDPADELVMLMLSNFEGKKTMSIEQYVKDQGLQSDNEQKDLTRDASKKELLDWVTSSLGNVKVAEIKAVHTQSEHPFVITAANHSAMRHVMRISQSNNMESLLLSLKPVLHVNFGHPATKGLVNLRRTNEKLAREVLEQIYDNALITAGLAKSVDAFVPRVNRILGQLLSHEKSTILTP